MKTLVIGFGNPGRGDDGIGPELARRLERLHLPGVTIEMDYQLSVEHAALVAEHDLTVFVDATVEGDAPFYFRPVEAAPTEAGLTHFVTPGQVVTLARACFGGAPPCYLLGVRAYEMDDFAEGLTPEAEAGLQAALAHLVRAIAQPLSPSTHKHDDVSFAQDLVLTGRDGDVTRSRDVAAIADRSTKRDVGTGDE